MDTKSVFFSLSLFFSFLFWEKVQAFLVGKRPNQRSGHSQKALYDVYIRNIYVCNIFPSVLRVRYGCQDFAHRAFENRSLLVFSEYYYNKFKSPLQMFLFCLFFLFSLIFNLLVIFRRLLLHRILWRTPSLFFFLFQKISCYAHYTGKTTTTVAIRALVCSCYFAIAHLPSGIADQFSCFFHY